MDDAIDESRTTIVAASAGRGSLLDYVSAVRDRLDAGGLEYKGPAAPPNVSHEPVESFLRYRSDPGAETTPDEPPVPEWVLTIGRNESGIAILRTAVDRAVHVFGRQFQVFGQRGAEAALDVDIPEDIAVSVGTRPLDRGQGCDPYTYDPNVDHVTDL